MTDLSKLSDAELQALYAKTAPDLSGMSDAELKAAHDKTSAVPGPIRAIDTGLGNAIAGMVAMPRTVTDLGALGIRYASDKVSDYFGVPRYEPLHNQGPIKEVLDKVMPTYDQARGELQKTFYEGEKPYQPQNKLEEYLQTGGEFALNALGPGGVVAKAAQVVVPTLASETLGQITKGKPIEPVARFLGALTGVGVTAFLRPGTTREVLERQLPRGITAQHVDDADVLIRDAATRGVDLTWPEALSQVSGQKVYSDLMRHLEASPQSARQVEDFFAARPQQVRAAATRGAEEISPGPATDPYALGPQVKEAAQESINEVRRDINRVADPFYYAASFQNASPQQMAYLQSLPGWAQSVAAVRGNPQLYRNVAGLPEESVTFLNAVKKEMGQRGEEALSPFRTRGRDVTESAGWTSDEAAVRTEALRASRAATAPGQVAPYQEALAYETQLRSRYLEPLLQGPLGEIADAQPKIKNALNVLFPAQPEAHSQAAIGNAVREISNRSPKLAQDVVRAQIEKAFDQGARNLQTGPNPAGGAKFFVRLAGTEQQRLNLQAAVEALPNGQQRWRGFNRLLEIMEATGTRQNIGSKTAYNTEALREIGGAAGSAAETGLKVAANPARFLQPIADKYDAWKMGRNLNELAAILTDRRSAGLLRNLAASRRGSFREANLVRAVTLANTIKPPSETSK